MARAPARSALVMLLTCLALLATALVGQQAKAASDVHLKVIRVYPPSNSPFLISLDGRGLSDFWDEYWPAGSNHTVRMEPYAAWDLGADGRYTCYVFERWHYQDSFGTQYDMWSNPYGPFGLPAASEVWIQGFLRPSQWYGVECYLGLNTQAKARAYYRTHTKAQARTAAATARTTTGR
jgi:hypothetical protein